MRNVGGGRSNNKSFRGKKPVAVAAQPINYLMYPLYFSLVFVPLFLASGLMVLVAQLIGEFRANASAQSYDGLQVTPIPPVPPMPVLANADVVKSLSDLQVTPIPAVSAPTKSDIVISEKLAKVLADHKAPFAGLTYKRINIDSALLNKMPLKEARAKLRELKRVIKDMMQDDELYDRLFRAMIKQPKFQITLVDNLIDEDNSLARFNGTENQLIVMLNSLTSRELKSALGRELHISSIFYCRNDNSAVPYRDEATFDALSAAITACHERCTVTLLDLYNDNITNLMTDEEREQFGRYVDVLNKHYVPKLIPTIVDKRHPNRIGQMNEAGLLVQKITPYKSQYIEWGNEPDLPNNDPYPLVWKFVKETNRRISQYHLLFAPKPHSQEADTTLTKHDAESNAVPEITNTLCREVALYHREQRRALQC